MRRIDDPSAAVTLPVPEAAGTEGFFTEGSPGVTPATLVRASFLNMVQEELRSIVVAGGLAPSKTTYNQVLLAIEALVQQSAGGYALDTGTANVCQVAYAPAVTAVNDGMVLKFRAKFANTGAATFAPNGLAAAPIWGGDHAAIGGGEIVANGDVWVQWNSALNGGTGAWLLIDSTGGFLRSPTPAQFDATTKLATMAAVQRALGNFSGVAGLAAATTLTNAALGITQLLGGVSNYNVTAPLAATCPAGSRLEFFCISNVQVNVIMQGTDQLIIQSTAGTGLALGPGDNLTIESNGVNWYAVGGTANLKNSVQFGASLASSGYQKLPSGLIIQWGGVTTSAASDVTITFPFTFPTGCFFISGSGYSGSATANWLVYFGVPSATGCPVAGYTANTAARVATAALWIAIGR